MQEGFSTLWDGYASDAFAMTARNRRASELRSKGRKVRKWVLRNQLKKYESFGVPDGRSCNVYMVSYEEEK